MYDLPIEFTEVLTVLTDLHLLKTGTIMSTWKNLKSLTIKNLIEKYNKPGVVT